MEKQKVYSNKKHNGNPFKARIRHQTKSWGKQKFNPTKKRNDMEPVGHKVPENATPWHTFKDNMLDSERELQNAKNVDINSAEAQQFLKQREQNHRKMLMDIKRKEPTKWEDFNDEPIEKESEAVHAGKQDSKKIQFKKILDGKNKRFKPRADNPFSNNKRDLDDSPLNKFEHNDQTQFRNKDAGIREAKQSLFNSAERSQKIVHQSEKGTNDGQNKRKPRKQNQQFKEANSQFKPRATGAASSTPPVDNMPFKQKNRIRKILTRVTIAQKGATLKQMANHFKSHGVIKRHYPEMKKT